MFPTNLKKDVTPWPVGSLLYKNNVWREAILRACLTGWSRPSSTTGHALEAMDRVLIDLGQLQARRDKLHAGLTGQGYEITKPEERETSR